MMSEQEVKQLLIDTQAILEGHFLLTSGLHSPMYVEKFNVLQHPKYTETLCKELAVMTLRRGFKIEPGTRVLIVEDIVTTGGSVQEVVNVVNQSGGEIVGVGLLVNRSGGKAEFGVPKEKVQALLNLEVPTYKPEECPLCKEGVAMTERGSKHIK